MKKISWLTFLLLFSITISSPRDSFANTSEKEPNNNFPDANPISVNEYVTGTLASSNDYDYFKFTLPKDGYIELEANNHSKHSQYYSIETTEDYINDLITSRTSPGTTKVTVGLAKGTHYIKVTSQDYNSNDPYQFKVNFVATDDYEKELNGTFQAATMIDVNKVYKGYLAEGDYDQDYFKFTNSKAGKYTIDLDNNGTDNKYLVLYDENRDFINDFETDRLLKGDSELILGLPAGTFYVRLSGSDYGENPYNLKVNFEENANYEKEKNNDFDTATPIKLDQYYNGVLDSYYDYDYFKFVLQKDDKVTFSTPHGTEKYITLVSRNEFFGDVYTEKDKGGDAKITKDLKAGTYYIRFSSGEIENEIYRFKVATSSSSVIRLEGPNRFETAVAISKKGWSTSNTVVLATGMDFPDALAGAPLAYKENAPILLTEKKKLTAITKKEIERLKAKKVIILGSEAAISKTVYNDLKGMGLSLKRLGGKDRFDTAALIANEISSNKAVIAYGMNFPDALAIAPYAARNGIPILLTQTSKLPDSTSKVISGKKEAIIVGDTGVVSDEVKKKLGISEVVRYGGETRYDTAKEIIINLKLGTDKAYVATGLNFPDALSGSALAAKNNAPILLVNGNKMPDSTKSLISKYNTFTLLGGEDVVGNDIKKLLD